MAIRLRTLWNGPMIARDRPRRHPTNFHLSPRRRDRIGQDFRTLFKAGFAGHQDRHVGAGQYRLRHASGHPVSQPAMGIRTHDEEVSADLSGFVEKDLADRAMIRRQSFYLCVHIMPGEIGPRRVTLGGQLCVSPQRSARDRRDLRKEHDPQPSQGLFRVAVR